MIARKIIELAKAGERDVEVLSTAALNLPAWGISAPFFLGFSLHRRRVDN
jgi:hypothetical protein